MGKAEDIIRKTFSGVAKAIGVQIDVPDETIADLAATLQTEIDRLEAAESESFEFLNELALAFRSGEKNARPQHTPILEGVRAVLAHLTAAGRLIPAGGMSLTAEQWAHYQRMAADPRFAELSRDALGVMKWPENPLLPTALFPATEPGEDGWGDVNPNDPQGRTYRETAEEYYSAPTETGPWHHRDGRICVYVQHLPLTLRYRIGRFNLHGDFVHDDSKRQLPEGFAPFVAAEEG